MTNPLEALLQERLKPLAAESIEIIDQSHLHAGHAGNQAGASHFEVRISAECFADLNKVQQHRMVYDLVNDLMPFPVHALALKLSIPTRGNT